MSMIEVRLLFDVQIRVNKQVKLSSVHKYCSSSFVLVCLLFPSLSLSPFLALFLGCLTKHFISIGHFHACVTDSTVTPFDELHRCHTTTVDLWTLAR